MKKTALQQLIEQLEEHKESVLVQKYQKGLAYAIQAAKNKLETEREQIEEAVKFGLKQRHDVFQGQENTDAQQYYKDNYEIKAIINSTQTTDNGVNVSERKQLLCEMMRKDEECGVYDDIGEIEQLLQRQDSLTEQLRDLRLVANKLGMYDAADYIKETNPQDNKLREAAERLLETWSELGATGHNTDMNRFSDTLKELEKALK